MSPILIATLAMLGLGLAAAVMLGIASKIFYVYEDPRIAKVEYALLGANCGGCGYPGCASAAEAVVNGEAGADVCIAGGPGIAIAVAEVMGIEVVIKERRVAKLRCRAGYRVDERYNYQGISDCRAAIRIWEGARNCERSCIGFGTCAKICPFNAIRMGSDGLPVIDPLVCTGCGTCVENCPKSVLELESMSDRLLSFNKISDCLAPCRQTCPAQIDIPQYIKHIQHGRFKEALITIRERNPIPLSIGRVCPHPCEYVCRRGLADEPVAINHLKRFAADIELNSNVHYELDLNPDTGHKVAVVGGGPAGLSCAYYLRRLGHSVTIFDMMPKLGGMLRYGIPEYRLPKKVLDFEIEGILSLGIEAHTSQKLGTDFTMEGLREKGFEAIFLGVGAWVSSPMRVEDEDSIGVISGIKFLECMHTDEEIELGKRVAIIGGGNTAMDAARTALRLGADSVTVVYRRTRKEMPAEDYEIEEAMAEGIEFHFLAAPSKIIIDANRRVHGLEYIRMELGEPDDSGRRRPVPVKGSETVMELDTIIAAIGQKPDLSFVDTDSLLKDGIEVTRWQTFIANEQTLQTAIPYVFTGGDCFTGPLTAVSAIGAGRRAARSIHQFLTDENGITPPPEALLDMIPESCLPAIYGISGRQRISMPELEPDKRTADFREVALGISPDAAIYESDRCLQCGVVCYSQDICEAL
ncbi:MAG TPA: RnfABCDGE type electron transport complex subunit B [bacterium]|nr:RnfABCDGE type electron transport complex subunit B [bacterium]